jgi:hypothetical protein
VQLSIFREPPPDALTSVKQEQKPTVFCDVLVSSTLDEKKQCIRVKPLPSSSVSSDLFVRCSHKARRRFPVGTVFKMDLRLTTGKRGKPYLVSRVGKPMLRAIEYFDHNLTLHSSQIKT